MPFALIAIAAIFIVTGIKGTASSFLSTLGTDMKGFVVWIVAIGVVGAVGFIPGLKKISDAFLVLILLVIFLSNNKQQNLFASFNQQIRSGASSATAPSSNTGIPDLTNPNSIFGSGGGEVQQQQFPTLPTLPSLTQVD